MSLSFYTAGKTWHAPKFQFLRDGFMMPVKARWIDADPESDLVKNHKGDLWQMCLEDVRDSNFVLLFCGDSDEEQRGALVEIGMAYSLGKRVYAVGNCKTITATDTSDVAFTHHPLWTWLPHTDLYKGAILATAMEMEAQKSASPLKQRVH